MEQIYFNGKIITMNAANEHEEKLNEPEAVLVKDGMISQIGKLADIEGLAGKDATKMDLDAWIYRFA